MPVPLVILGALAKIALNKDVKAAIVKAVAPKAGRVPLSAEAAAAVADVVTDLAKDPSFLNATNSEKPAQSRVTIGGSQSFLGALAFLLPIVLNYFGIKVDEAYLIQLFGALMALWGGIYTIWGRWAPDLKPLFSSVWGKVMGALGLGSIFAALVLVIVMVLR